MSPFFVTYKKIARLGSQGNRSGELTKQPFFCLWQPQKKANQRKGAKKHLQDQKLSLSSVQGKVFS